MRYVLLLLLAFSLLLPSEAIPGAESATVASPPPAVRHCGAVLNFVGLTLVGARALAKRCRQPLGYILRVLSTAPPGTVISQSQPNTGNSLVVSTGPLTNKRAVLRGAAGSPVSTECTATITLTEDGNAYPRTCYRSHVNVEAWDFYAALHARIMRLPRKLTVCQVAAHIIDARLTSPEQYSAFELANVYNGWHVPNGLAAHLIWGLPYHGITCAGGRRS
jgi:hypothetical protein